MRKEIYCYFGRNYTVFTEEQNPDQCVRLNLELFSGKLNNVEIVNAINTRGIYALVEYSGYLVLIKNDNKIPFYKYRGCRLSQYVQESCEHTEE